MFCTICEKVIPDPGGLLIPLDRTTCSVECHEELIRQAEAVLGKYKKVIRLSTGVAYQVPTRDMIEKGIKELDLDKYPLWPEGAFNG